MNMTGSGIMADYYHKQLYGSCKENLQEEVKKLCAKDSVKETLCSGQDDTTPELKWIKSSSETDYNGEGVTIERKKGIQNVTNFVLGIDKTRYILSTEHYKWPEHFEKREIRAAENKTNIPDFSKTLLGEEKASYSNHQTSYHVDPNKPRPKPKSHAERQKQANYSRGTHFRLGTWQCENTSETTHTLSFAKQHLPETVLVREQKKDTSKVFRSGDWNQRDKKSQAESITKNDFHHMPDMKSIHLTRENEFTKFTHPTYHYATHFDLGSVTNENTSIYGKDFLENSHSNMKLTSKVGPIHKLNLFPSNRETDYVSTNEHSFQNNGEEVSSKLRREGIEAFEHTKMIDNLNSVPLSGNNRDSNFQAKNLSMTASEFQEANLVSGEKESIHIPVYNHLNEHYFTSDTKTSEVMSEYVPHKHTSKKARDECRQSCHNSKSTHFILGTNLTNDQNSTTSLQFGQPIVLPSCKLRAAGKSLPLNNERQHVLPTPEDNLEDSLMKTITQDHYRTPDNRNASHRQQAMEKSTKLHFDTHFFHKHDEFQETQQSTTISDFISPVKMSLAKKCNNQLTSA